MTTILCVCTGNLCRSPAAALLLHRRLGDLATVASAGTMARPGRPIPRPMRAELRRDGPRGLGGFGRQPHRSRALTRAMAGAADVVIVMAEDPADIPDPMGGSRAEFASAYALLREQVDAVAAWVRGA